MDTRETYNRIASDWHKDHKDDDWWKEGVDTFISLLPEGGTVLDVGCGGGVKARYMLDRGFKVTGIDTSENLIEIAKEHAAGGTFYTHSMLELDSISDKFDGVFAQASLLHMKKADAPNVVAAMARRAYDAGLVYVAVKERRQVDEEVVTEDDYGYEYQRFFSYYTMPELERYFTDAGLEVVWKEAKLAGSTVWLQVIGRKT